MLAAFADTHPAAARVQLELLRNAGFERRAELVRSLSASVIGMSRAALKERMPGASERDIAIRWIELNYGAELATRLRGYLDQR